MKQVIGFTNKFYTLWTYDAEKVSIGQYNGYIKHNWHYIQNLSFDLKKAKAKYPNAEIDLQQRGDCSFTTFENYDQTPDEIMWFGQFKGGGIDIIPEKYILWLLDNCDDKARIIRHSKIARDIIAKREAESIAQEKRIAEIEALPNETEIEVLFERNLTIVGEYFGDDGIGESTWRATHGAYYFDFNGLSICLLFEDYKYMEYNEHPYGLPCIKGKAKRIKNKTLRLQLMSGNVVISQSKKTQTFIVKSFQLL
jgi:hypothetical protein